MAAFVSIIGGTHIHPQELLVGYVDEVYHKLGMMTKTKCKRVILRGFG